MVTKKKAAVPVTIAKKETGEPTPWDLGRLSVYIENAMLLHHLRPNAAPQAGTFAVLADEEELSRAFAWLKRQDAVRCALAAFERTRRQRKDQLKFSDGLEGLRFWQLATATALHCSFGVKPLRDPSAKERANAAAAVKTLTALACDTTLFHLLGNDATRVSFALMRLGSAVSADQRAKRKDAQSTATELVCILTDHAIEILGDAPLVLIHHLASLCGADLDEQRIKRLVTAAKRQPRAVRLVPVYVQD